LQAYARRSQAGRCPAVGSAADSASATGLVLTAAGIGLALQAPRRLTGRPTGVPADAASPLTLEAYTHRPMQVQSLG
jgi:hypothetical protein